MANYAALLQTIAFVFKLSTLWTSHCYSGHGRLHRCNFRLNDTSQQSNKVIPADEDIAKRLIERHRDEIQRYLNPLDSGLGEQLSTEELVQTFGKPLTPENISKKSQESTKPLPFDLPNVEPTNKLPYFVNLEFPPEESKDQTFHQQTEGLDSNPNDPHNEGRTHFEDPKNKELTVIPPKEDSSRHCEKTDSSNVTLDAEPDLSHLDPLRELMDRNPPYPDLEEEYGPKWYLSDKRGELSEVELEDGWSILPCGKVYKHLLQPSELFDHHKKKPEDETCVTFMFKMMEAKSNQKIVETEDTGGSMVTTYMGELGPVFQKCLKSMEPGEQAEFIFHVSEYNPDNMIIEDLTGVTWIRLWINLWESHHPNEKWWGLGPGEAHLYPETRPSNKPKLEKLEEETNEITSQIESELCNNPCSPLWSDVLEKMNSRQKESYVEHFDRQLEKIERMKCSEFTGSRSFGEQIKSTGQVQGYDLGHQAGGVSKFFTWRETPFMMYIAVSVIPGVRAEHVNLNLTSTHLTLSIADKTVIDDDLTGSVDLDSPSVWAMSDSASSHPPLDRSDNRLTNPTISLTRVDQYDAVSKTPSILIFLKKARTSTSIWGAPFVNI